MARRSKALEDGILSIGDIATLLSFSIPKVRRLIDTKSFPGSYTNPDTRERRVPAPGILSYLKDNEMPIPRAMQNYITAYYNTYPPAKLSRE